MQVGGKGLAQKPEIQTIVGPESETMVVCGWTACAQSQLGLLSAIVSRDGLPAPAPGSCPHPSFMSPFSGLAREGRWRRCSRALLALLQRQVGQVETHRTARSAEDSRLQTRNSLWQTCHLGRSRTSLPGLHFCGSLCLTHLGPSPHYYPQCLCSLGPTLSTSACTWGEK